MQPPGKPGDPQFYVPHNGVFAMLVDPSGAVSLTPTFGNVALYYNEDGLVEHAAIVLGSSHSGEIYCVGKYNTSQPIDVVGSSDPRSPFTDPRIFPPGK